MLLLFILLQGGPQPLRTCSLSRPRPPSLPKAGLVLSHPPFRGPPQSSIDLPSPPLHILTAGVALRPREFPQPSLVPAGGVFLARCRISDLGVGRALGGGKVCPWGWELSGSLPPPAPHHTCFWASGVSVDKSYVGVMPSEGVCPGSRSGSCPLGVTESLCPPPPAGVWVHGDYCRINPKTRGVIMLGRR